MSEVIHMRRASTARMKLSRMHTPQPVSVEPAVVGEETSWTGSGRSDVSGACPVCPPPADDPADAYTRGMEEGKRIADGEFREALARIRAEEAQRTARLIGGLASQMKELQQTVEQDAYRFALAVAERITRREVTLTDDIVITQIKEAIQRVAGVESIKLRVHPSDEAVVRAHRGVFLASLDNLRDLVIETDEGVERGGCVIESTSGNVDARISTQLRQIESSLFGMPRNGTELLP